MSKTVISSVPLNEFSLWDKIGKKRTLSSFVLEVTARCNNNCRHCYINLPPGDRKAKEQELSLAEIQEIAEEAVSLGALWCLITGGEPLLREDFPNIYLSLKKKGLLVSVFTNATLLTQEHIRLFKKYPPRDIEVTVYGVTKETYEGVTRRKGSFAAFMRGLDLLMESGIRARLKAVVLRSNVHEMAEIASFCQKRTGDYFRFDPFLHLRLDGNQLRNREIISQRLSPKEIVALERADSERFKALEKNCNTLILQGFSDTNSDDRLFHCGAGNKSFVLGHDGLLRLCSSLCHPACVYDLKKGTLGDAWHNFIPSVRDRRSKKREFLENCQFCTLVNICTWCPAHSYLETGDMDAPVEYFCEVAHAREEMLKKA